MSRVSYRKTRRDKNSKEVIARFRHHGFHVLDTAIVPNAFDCLVSLNGHTVAIEIKSSRSSKLTDGERVFKDSFQGWYEIIYDEQDVDDLALHVRSLKCCDYLIK